MITSSSNLQIKDVVKLLKYSRERRKQKLFIVEGTKMVEEARRRKQIQKIYMSESYYQNNPEILKNLEYEIVAENIFNQICMTTAPQGVLAKVHMPFYTWDEITGIHRERLLILENIQDPGNVGTMIRTAEGAGFHGVVMSSDTVDLFNPKVVRSTMGSVFRMPFIYMDDFNDCLKDLRDKGYFLYAADLQGAQDYDKQEYSGKCGLIIGNEANGIRQDTIQLAQSSIKIPMDGEVESLNAAAAAAILMYNIRQRR